MTVFLSYPLLALIITSSTATRKLYIYSYAFTYRHTLATVGSVLQAPAPLYFVLSHVSMPISDERRAMTYQLEAKLKVATA
ncbi:hypothetical protein EV421DRAFT_1251814 [Armillaria borealis]|uniref:Secreted protein n=1 Tax=Armillaria borealis TaxID=47425 RepID=A0AA39J480_9AGAR|nr:hypothetical protein EV421DRAFT_1251814 [Armillaria borealis]